MNSERRLLKMTSKQRAYLRSYASTQDTILQIGKGEINENIIKQADDALEARELIKIRCLETAPYTPLEAANILAEECNAEVICTIGTKAVLYRHRKKDPKIVLPK